VTRRRRCSQTTLLDLDLGMVVATQFTEPLLPAGTIGDAIVEAELIGIAVAAVGCRHPSGQGHRELRSEACAQA
jgi:hypothetical protein